MPITFWTMLFGSLALAGIFPLAGFWSKDEILVVAKETGTHVAVRGVPGDGGASPPSTRRAWCCSPSSASTGVTAHPHESPPTMTGPLVFLAFCTIGRGTPRVAPARSGVRRLGLLRASHEGTFVSWIAVLVHRGRGRRAARSGTRSTSGGGSATHGSALGPMWNMLENRYYIDAFYMRAIVYPMRDTLSAAVYWINQNVLDAIVNGAAALARAASRVIVWSTGT